MAPQHCSACGEDLSAGKALGEKNNFSFIACPACGSVTVAPFPTPDELDAFYQSYEGTTDYLAKEDKKIARAKKRIAPLIGKKSKDVTFLDVGSNHGFTVKAALEMGLNAFGIDIDTPAIEKSRERYGAFFKSIPVEDYAAEGHKADVIYTSEVIEHVHNPDSFVKAISDILNKDGILYLTTPEARHWMNPKNFADWHEARPPEHLTYFTKKGMRALLKRHGLIPEKFVFNIKPGIKVIARKAV